MFNTIISADSINDAITMCFGSDSAKIIGRSNGQQSPFEPQDDARIDAYINIIDAEHQNTPKTDDQILLFAKINRDKIKEIKHATSKNGYYTENSFLFACREMSDFQEDWMYLLSDDDVEVEITVEKGVSILDTKAYCSTFASGVILPRGLAVIYNGFYFKDHLRVYRMTVRESNNEYK